MPTVFNSTKKFSMSASNPMGPLSELQAFIDACWVEDADVYPPIARLNEQDTKRFLRQHKLRHLHKALGAIEAIEEKVDHSAAPIEREMLREPIGKMLLNLMQYAKKAGITGDEIGEWIADFYRKQH